MTLRALTSLAILFTCHLNAQTKPNVILIITDDQGYGDVRAHGNTMIETPNMDRMHGESVRLTNFHVDPTCAPTRSALMTGRYSTRTGVWHTIMGRSLMDTKEVTVAETFKAAGYKTGMYGKWHLGDNYPLRPHDQGFEEAFYHGGGGVTQTPDYFGNDYFDDTYFRNGVPEKATGYCTDVWFGEAIKFIEKNKDKPFFTYITTNAPHGPFLVADNYKQPYIEKGVSASMAAFYGMITNIDENLGKLRARLKELNLEENTILIFMTDNGSAVGETGSKKTKSKDNQQQSKETQTWNGFNAGMRGTKGSEYEGGHRVPFFVYWPKGGLTGGRDVNTLAAHIDVLPTLADLCGIAKPQGVTLDGISLTGQLKISPEPEPDRTLFVQSQRMEFVQKGRKNSVMTKRWRLVNSKELYDIQQDPGQTKNVADANPAVFKTLNQSYDSWWESLSSVFDKYVRIGLGNNADNPANLTCHDWHTNNKPVPWNQGHIRTGPFNNGFWAVDVELSGNYVITLRRWPKQENKSVEAISAKLKIGDQEAEINAAEDATGVQFKLKLEKGPTKLETWLTTKDGKVRGAYFVEVEFTGQG
ncbi:MAG: arylsulfatase [Planctomycetota bacterium]|nr:arylsulfatase [Planctomycetota bacterium]